MARKKKKLTKNQQLYEKELNRIKRYLRRKVKEGFDISNFKIPERPARVTAKRLKEIKELTGRKIRYRISKILPQPEPIGDKINIPGGTIAPSKESLSRQDQDWIIVNNFLDQLKALPTVHIKPVTDLINGWLNLFDLEEVAAAIQAMPRRVTDFVSRYGSEFDYEGFSTTFLSYIPGITKAQQTDAEDLINGIITGEYYV